MKNKDLAKWASRTSLSPKFSSASAILKWGIRMYYHECKDYWIGHFLNNTLYIKELQNGKKCNNYDSSGPVCIISPSVKFSRFLENISCTLRVKKMCQKKINAVHNLSNDSDDDGVITNKNHHKKKIMKQQWPKRTWTEK